MFFIKKFVFQENSENVIAHAERDVECLHSEEIQRVMNSLVKRPEFKDQVCNYFLFY